MIIEHVSNSSLDHPILQLWTLGGIDFSVTKHVMMLWLVSGTLFLVMTLATRRYLSQERRIPTGFMNALEWLVQAIRDSMVLPNVGLKFVDTWTPLILTLFVFILASNAIGLVPIFEVLGLVDRFALSNAADSDSWINTVLHGGTTATANYNVTAGLAIITFVSIIVAGTMAHGFVKHWKNLVPPGHPWPIYVLLIPIELMGMIVKPFALTMRLAPIWPAGTSRFFRSCRWSSSSTRSLKAPRSESVSGSRWRYHWRSVSPPSRSSSSWSRPMCSPC